MYSIKKNLEPAKKVKFFSDFIAFHEPASVAAAHDVSGLLGAAAPPSEFGAERLAGLQRSQRGLRAPVEA